MNQPPLPAASAVDWPKLLQTPLADLVRGRLTGRLGIGAVVDAAALPEALADLIYRVARRTRLWRVERVDVTRELIEHFRDGLAAGRTPEQLVESFGDVKQSARLIRRAKLRGRPLFWRLWRRAVQALAGVAALMVGCYLFLAIRLFAHHPTIAHNYSLDLIAPTEGVAEADRAWPFYRAALLHQTPEPRVVDESNLIPGQAADAEPLPGQPLVPLDYLAEKPGSRHWAKVERWLDENKVAIEEVRQGAAMPRFGFVYGDPSDRAWLEWKKLDPERMNPRRNELIIAFILEQQQEVRRLGQMLEADARRALAAGDRKVFLRDIAALIGMAVQLQGDLAFLVVDLISYSVIERALVLVDEALSEHPGVLLDEDLAHLAHRIASYAGGGQIVPRLAGERAVFHDFIQRVYSNDGHGDGVMTLEGLKSLESFDAFSDGRGHGLVRGSPSALALRVPMSAVFLSRREITECGDALYDRAEADMERPLWQLNGVEFTEQLQRLDRDDFDSVRYAPLLCLAAQIDGIYSFGQWLTQKRDATVVELALTLFQRRRGVWPDRLDDLVPDLLPAVPADRFTGDPIRYRVVDGKPVVYSVGPDKVDDGGKPPDDPRNLRQVVYQYCTRIGKPPTNADVGWDWILWPPHPESPNSEAE